MCSCLQTYVYFRIFVFLYEIFLTFMKIHIVGTIGILVVA